MKLRILCMLIASLTSGCIDTGQDHVRVPLFVAGTDVSQSVVAVGNTPVTIERADLAFGPLYLCAGKTAGDLCETARLEWLDAAVVDTTNPTRVQVGKLSGVTGPVQSWMYDLGFSSQLTSVEPFVHDAAKKLGKASLVLKGSATVDGIQIPFTASVTVQQADGTGLGVPVVHKSTSEAFFRDVSVNESGLVVRFDPGSWVRTIDFRVYVVDEACTPGGPDVVCSKTTESTCDDDGDVVEQRDCKANDHVCLSGLGCRGALVLETDSEAFRGLHNALLSGGHPSFEWDDVPNTPEKDP